jgi:hypothetical protein
MSRIDADSTYVTDVLPGIVVFGLGLSLTVAPLTATVLGAVSDEHAGVASGVNNAVARTGALLAIAAVPIIAGIAPGADVDRDELITGFHQVLRVSAIAAACAAAVAWVTVGGRRMEHTEEETFHHCAAAGPPAVARRVPAAR